jgi:hypothetical protein
MWFIQHFEERWENKQARTQILDLMKLIEKDYASLLMTHHYIAVAEK